MEAKTIKEYLSVKINGKMRTVLIERKIMMFDNRMIQVGDSKKWMNYMRKLIINLFNTNEWSYLGNEDNFTAEEEEKVLKIKVD